MPKLAGRIILRVFLLLVLAGAALLNFWLPLYVWLGDTPVYRFIWLGIFFVILDMAIELIVGVAKQVNLLSESLSLGMDLKKMTGSFRSVSKFTLSNGSRADYIVVGSSGVWLLVVKDDNGRITFNGDDLVRDGVVLKGLLADALQKSYSLAALIKERLNKDVLVVPIVGFSSPRSYLESVPKQVRGVYVAVRKDIIPLIENTDAQLIDEKSIEEIYKLLSKK